MKIEVHAPTIRRKEMDAVLTVLVEEKIGPGEQSQRLIQTAKEALHFDYALALRSPAIALTLALRAFDGEDGAARRGVLISALSPRYYEQAIFDAGCVPVFCDVEPATAMISAATVNTALEKSAGDATPRCIVLHETLGFLPDMAALAEIGLPLIEDCSASLGARFGEQPAGSFGALAILGLEERDMLTSGGGALLFAMERRNAGALRNYAGLAPEYGIPDMNAAMALAQFREAARNGEKRAELARLYTDAALRGGRHKLIAQPDNFEYNNYAFALILESGMKEVSAWAKKKEIDVELAFAGSLAAAGGVPTEVCPAASSLALRTALFPLYPRLGAEAAQKVARLIQTLP